MALCKYCGVLVDKMEFSSGNICQKCKIQKKRLYQYKHYHNAKSKRSGGDNTK